MRICRIGIVILLFLIFSCERRIFLDKIPEIVYENDRYIFESWGQQYDRVVLSSETSVIELTPCKEELTGLEIFDNKYPDYYDLFIVSGNDTSLVNNCYIGVCSSDDLQITVLDVFQGDCFIISPPDEIPSVIDGGFGSLGYEDWHGAGEEILADHLGSCNKYNLKYLIETHHDQDHYGGLYDIKDDGRFSFDEYLTYDSELTDSGDTLYFSPSVKGVIIHSGLISGDEETDENDRSVVLKLMYGDFEMIFTGDITGTAEEIILSGDLLDASEDYEILKVSHHGSKYASGEAFLSAVLPIFSMISSGEGNPYGHPSEEALERLESVGSSVLRTDINGTVDIYSDGRSFQISYSR